MKKLTVLLITLIIVSQISICLFAFEATADEADALYTAEEYVKNCYSNMYIKTDYDILKDTVAGLDDLQKSNISEKAKEYENEIRKNHRYHYYEDNQWYFDHMDECDENGVYYTGVTPPAKQYDNTAIEDVISSFPVFIEKKIQFQDSWLHFYTKEFREYRCICRPKSITVSESGFAYVNMNGYYSFYYDDLDEITSGADEIYVLLYKLSNGQWIICDVSTFWDNYDEEYRFNSENMDIEKELLSKGYTPSSENESTEPSQEVKDDKETGNPQNESKPLNYIPWVICTAEAAAIIALVIALVIKKRNNIIAAENNK